MFTKTQVTSVRRKQQLKSISKLSLYLLRLAFSSIPDNPKRRRNSA